MEDNTFLGKYRVELDAAGMPVELRRNASGVTCKAHEIESGRAVALEVVPMRGLNSDIREKIEVDAIARKQLNHVNIPTLYDFAFDGNDLVYVTEYFEGITAESWVTTHGPMPVRAVLHIALQVVSALGAAAFHLVFHRTIHPENILIVPGQTAEGDWPLVKVLNFGRRAPRSSGSAERNGGIDKSAPFASPEQVKDGTVDFRSEIYSLGCTLWSLLTGVSPFSAPGEMVGEAQMAVAMKRFSGVPKKIRHLITEMAATNPDDRPLDPVVMTERLQNCLASVKRREAIARKLGIPVKWQRRVAKPVRPLTARPIAMAAVVLALAALSAAYLTNRSQFDSLWKRYVSRPPIGVPIGVPDPSVSPAGNVSVQRAAGNDAAMAASEADLVTNLNATKSPATNVTSTPSADTSPVTTSPLPAVASANQDTAPASSNPQPNESDEQSSAVPAPPNVAAAVQNNVPVIPAESQPPSPNEPNTKAVDSPIPETTLSPAPAVTAATTETAAIKPTEQATVADSAALSANKVPRAELIEPPPSKSTTSRKQVADTSNQGVVPRAELVEPPPPTEGPDDAIANNSAREKGGAPSMENVPRAELIEPPPAASAKLTRQKSAQSSYAPSRSELAAIRNASRRTHRARIWADGDGAMVQTPGGMVHARFVGTTPDGQWMLSLPSRKIMIVPPPPDFIPR